MIVPVAVNVASKFFVADWPVVYATDRTGFDVDDVANIITNIGAKANPGPRLSIDTHLIINESPTFKLKEEFEFRVVPR